MFIFVNNLCVLQFFVTGKLGIIIAVDNILVDAIFNLIDWSQLQHYRVYAILVLPVQLPIVGINSSGVI